MTTFAEIEAREDITKAERYLRILRKIFDDDPVDLAVVKSAWFFSSRKLISLISEIEDSDRRNVHTVTKELVNVLADSGLVSRRRLPDERKAITKRFVVGGVKGYFTVGFFEDGSPGELFIKMAKEGSTLSGLIDGLAIVVSIALQHRVPLETIVEKLSCMRFEPQGFTGDPDIKVAHSILDFIFRWIEHRFLKKEEETQLLEGEKEAESDEEPDPTEEPDGEESDDTSQPNETTKEDTDERE